MIENKKLKNLPTKGPNCREPWTISFSKASVEINIAVDTCIEVIPLKTVYCLKIYTMERESISLNEKKITA